MKIDTYSYNDRQVARLVAVGVIVGIVVGICLAFVFHIPSAV